MHGLGQLGPKSWPTKQHVYEFMFLALSDISISITFICEFCMQFTSSLSLKQASWVKIVFLYFDFLFGEAISTVSMRPCRTETEIVIDLPTAFPPGNVHKCYIRNAEKQNMEFFSPHCFCKSCYGKMARCAKYWTRALSLWRHGFSQNIVANLSWYWAFSWNKSRSLVIGHLLNTEEHRFRDME